MYDYVANEQVVLDLGDRGTVVARDIQAGTVLVSAPAGILTRPVASVQPVSAEHAHINWYSRDCDGAQSGHDIQLPNDEERCNPNGDLLFRQRMLAAIMDPWGNSRVVTTPDEATAIQDIGEGFKEVTVIWCSKAGCPGDDRWVA